MSFKKLICLLLSLALALGLALPALAEGGALEGKMVILHTNDVHGRAVSANGVWGYAAPYAIGGHGAAVNIVGM